MICAIYYCSALLANQNPHNLIIGLRGYDVREVGLLSLSIISSIATFAHMAYSNTSSAEHNGPSWGEPRKDLSKVMGLQQVDLSRGENRNAIGEVANERQEERFFERSRGLIGDTTCSEASDVDNFFQQTCAKVRCGK